MPRFTKRVGFVAAENDEAQQAYNHFTENYDHVDPQDADIIVALGGDGFMLRTLHTHLEKQTPIYGMNRGSVGFLMNKYTEDNLLEHLARAQPFELHPLRMVAENVDGERVEALAINEVSLFRQTGQTAHIRVIVDEKVRLDDLVCDGVLLCTPAGSTAYNTSAYGPILPLGSKVLGLTAISAYRPRRWRGAILPHQAKVSFEILSNGKRPVSATADFTEVRNVTRVTIHEDRSKGPILLFDPEHNLEERILSEQFQN
ncbi:MAG: NAD kinase [Rhodospirillales bacterium]|nr:NAD kinase [Rhodospirillales bacterium]